MISPTLGEVSIPKIAGIIQNKVVDQPGEYNVMIGTDSQNFDRTKVVLVIAIHHVGHGGVFFYEIQHVQRITNVGQKLLYETDLSLGLASKLVAELEKLKSSGFNYEKHINIGIHVDAGENGPSKQVIPEIIGWINSFGYKAIVKPNSYAASSIANKYSK